MESLKKDQSETDTGSRRVKIISENVEPLTEKGLSVYLKVIPIAISIIALLVSYLSWQESRRNTSINEEINRPILTLGEVEPNMILFSDSSKNLIEFTANLKNTGRTTAQIKSTHVLGFFSNSTEHCNGKVDSEIYQANAGIKELLSGTEQGYLGRTMLSGECSSVTSLNFNVYVVVTYASGTTQKEYQQYFAKELNISFADLKKRSEELLRKQIKG